MVKTPSQRYTIPGSERLPLPGARPIGAVHPGERIEVTVRVRSKAATGASDRAGYGEPSWRQRNYLTREQHAAAHGASAADLDKIAAFAQAQGLQVVQSDAARRSVVLSGDAASLGAAFGVKLQHYEHPSGTYRGRSGTISVPQELAGVVEGVFGLDNRPQAIAHFLRHDPQRGQGTRAAASFTPNAVGALYGFPTGLDGSGQCVGIIELGGGYRPADLTAYFDGLGLPVPTVRTVLVDHARNDPTNANSADGEVMLDIEVVGAIAPKAAIAVYFAPNTNQGFLDAVTTAVHDTVHRPSVISISWGSAESTWTGQAMTQFDQAFQAAAAMGVTVCVAAGDNGSGDGVSDGKPHVDFPASSPHALACGGTLLGASGQTITSEVVWNEGPGSATGGGVSGFFALPSFQAAVAVPPIAGTTQTGRGVPDVAGDADPASGYQVRVDGQGLVIGGTSAVAPLWSGLVALMNQHLGKPVGWLQPILYGPLAGQAWSNDIVSGNNGAYSAGPGWDACSGWGSPNGTRLLQALAG